MEGEGGSAKVITVSLNYKTFVEIEREREKKNYKPASSRKHIFIITYTRCLASASSAKFFFRSSLFYLFSFQPFFS